MLRSLLPACLFLGATATLCAQTNISFELQPDSYATDGATPVSGDFNGDGKPDYVSDNGSSLVFRAGNGDGTFQAPVTAASAPQGVGAMQAADMNGDGILDLVGISNLGSGTAYVWFGQGNGTFGAPTSVPLTGSSSALAVGNFFNDGQTDFAVGDTSGNIELFRNEGGGNFTLAKTVAMPASGSDAGITTLAAGNLNGNGISDLAVTVGIGTAYVVWNNGQGTFTPALLNTYTYPQVAVARLNSDGMDDVIVSYTCNPQSNPVQAGHGAPVNACAGFDVYYGQGNNQYFKRTVVTDPNVFSPGIFADRGIWGGDVNGDGYGDIVATTTLADGQTSGLFVWQGNADGSFSQTPQQYIFATGELGELAAADFNRDGMMDFVEGNVSSGDGEVYLNATQKPVCGKYTISPTVTVCQPVDGTYSNGPVTLEANTFDTKTVTALQEYIDGELVYSEDVPNFDQVFSEGLGTHQFVTKAWDASGVSFRANRTITVYSGTPGVTCSAAPASASICLPTAASSSTPVHIVGNGYTAAVPTSAQLYINGTLTMQNKNGSSAVDTYQSLSAGTYDVVFKLWDAAGNVYTAEKSLTVE